MAILAKYGLNIMSTAPMISTGPASSCQVWSLTLGWNHAEDTLECLNTLRASRGLRLRMLFVDNGSREEEVRRVLDGARDVEVLRHEQNVGVPRGFNAGLAWALRKGANFIFMANNDTAMEPDTLLRLLEAARQEPAAGIVMPVIGYYDAPDAVWSAGSRFRRFPPAIVMNRRVPAGRAGGSPFPELDFSPLCTALVRAEALKKIGLMDPTYEYYFDDYDLSLRMRDAGYKILLVPDARTRHKVDRVTRPGAASASFWENSGRSAGIFSRRHRARHPWLAGVPMLSYLALRAGYEGSGRGWRAFRAGLRAGRRLPLKPVPAWNDGSTDPVTLRRECGTLPAEEGD